MDNKNEKWNMDNLHWIIENRLWLFEYGEFIMYNIYCVMYDL